MGLFRETMATILESYFRGLNLTDDAVFLRSHLVDIIIESKLYFKYNAMNLINLYNPHFKSPINFKSLSFSKSQLSFQKSSGKSRASHHSMVQQ